MTKPYQIVAERPLLAIAYNQSTTRISDYDFEFANTRHNTIWFS
ncbi:hypothetical protein [Scytonema sp. PCC 10023]